jgi:phage terminase large subunit-like protein
MLDFNENLTELEEIELLSLLQTEQSFLKTVLYKSVYDTFYPWQKDFAKATAEYFECCLCAANQIGKTYTGTDLDALHLMGDYPDSYEGYKFDFPPLCWLLGYSMEKTRDLLQTALFGRMLGGKFEGGLIPADHIISHESSGGTTNAMRTVRVKHKLGVSVVQFWSYAQGQHAIMGDVVDWFHVDEEPRDQKIRPQLLTRTINGDKGKGGRGIYTFTPENGRTDLVVKFMDDPDKSQFFMQKGWVDAPHINPEKAERLLGSYPTHQRDMRSKGTPMLGHGRIYDLSEDFITCDAFDIPKHFYVINGMDFGWDHPQAHIQLCWDRDMDIFYVTKGIKMRQTSPDNAWGAVKKWADGVPSAWPLDGLQTEKGSGKQQMQYYTEAGFNMLDERATWEDGSNGVEAGLYEIRDLMSKGKFKVFAGLRDVLDEVSQYHRNEKGNIVKVGDDLWDAIRYAYMMRRESIPFGDILAPIKSIEFTSEW